MKAGACALRSATLLDSRSWASCVSRGPSRPGGGAGVFVFQYTCLPAGLHLAWIRSDGYFPESCGNRPVLQLTVDRPVGPDASLAMRFQVRQSWLISLASLF